MQAFVKIPEDVGPADALVVDALTCLLWGEEPTGPMTF